MSDNRDPFRATRWTAIGWCGALVLVVLGFALYGHFTGGTA